MLVSNHSKRANNGLQRTCFASLRQPLKPDVSPLGVIVVVRLVNLDQRAT